MRPIMAVQQLKKEIERNITPPLECQVDVLQSQGAPVLRVQIPNGSGQAVCARPDARLRPRGRRDDRGRARRARAARPAGPTSWPKPSRRLSRQLRRPQPEPRLRQEPQGRAPGRQRRPARQQPADRAPARSPGSRCARARAARKRAVPLPSIGVELVSMEERKGGRYFTIRDLRNGNVVQNVTIHSARKLWSYAINQHLTHPNGPDDVTWRGDLGLWQAARRGEEAALRPGPADARRQGARVLRRHRRRHDRAVGAVPARRGPARRRVRRNRAERGHLRGAGRGREPGDRWSRATSWPRRRMATGRPSEAEAARRSRGVDAAADVAAARASRRGADRALKATEAVRGSAGRACGRARAVPEPVCVPSPSRWQKPSAAEEACAADPQAEGRRPATAEAVAAEPPVQEAATMVDAIVAAPEPSLRQKPTPKPRRSRPRSSSPKRPRSCR